MINLDMFITNVFTGFSIGLGTGLVNYFVFKKFLSKLEEIRKEKNEYDCVQTRPIKK